LFEHQFDRLAADPSWPKNGGMFGREVEDSRLNTDFAGTAIENEVDIMPEVDGDMSGPRGADLGEAVG
jgi:hypothetical protein